MKSIGLSIDGKRVDAVEGASVLEVAKANGIYIPALCAHPEDSPFACRLCIVAVEGMSDLPASCTLAATDGMIVWTDTPNLNRKRRKNLIKLLENHPSCCLNCSRVERCDSTVCQRKPDYEQRCANCAKDGRCELQKAAGYIKLKEEIILPFKPRNEAVWKEDLFFERDYNLCIGCGQCVTACKEILGVEALALKMDQDGKAVAGARLGGSLRESGCRFCGVCAEVCPTSAIVQKIEKEGVMSGRPESLVPCRHTCPIGIDVPSYVKYIADGEFTKAYEVIRAKTPFAGTLAYICPHPCEDQCRRKELNGSIAIRALKRFASENKNGTGETIDKAPQTGKRVAIVGAGPAGLTSAYHMAKLGHSVTVFEARSNAGGMMWWGIPMSQLPQEVLHREIGNILEFGVDMRLGAAVNDVEALFDEGYDCVFLAVGLQTGIKLRIPGADMENVLLAVDFLSLVNGGNKVKIGDKVLVLGGGAVAVDCAFVARRLGAKEVSLACLESREKMPAHSWMVEEAEEECITIYPSLTFTEIVNNNGKVEGVKCQRLKSMKFEEGKLCLDIIPDSELILGADTVIFAIGQGIEPLQNWGGVELTSRGTIAVVNADTLETGRPGVFAGGDAVSGPLSVVGAIKAGRIAAQAMDRYLGGTGLIDGEAMVVEENNFWLGRNEVFCDMDATNKKSLSLEKRVNSFELVEFALEKAEAVNEASRCMRCDLRMRILDRVPIKAKADLMVASVVKASGGNRSQ